MTHKLWAHHKLWDKEETVEKKGNQSWEERKPEHKDSQQQQKAHLQLEMELFLATWPQTTSQNCKPKHQRMIR